MGFFDKLFSFGSGRPVVQPEIPFGRYTDAYKSDAQQAFFDRALELFEEGKRLESYEAFFSYLKDEKNENIRWTRDGESLNFDFWQGSQRIAGFATPDKFKAESRVARAEDLNVGFLRRLMEANFSLKFSRFALSPDDFLIILFDTSGVDASPLKLQHALRELAVNADKQDDLLLDEFKTLKPAVLREHGEMDDAEKEAKYSYVRREIERVFVEMDQAKPDPNQFPGTYAYMLLALAFKLDYLIRPEGFMMDCMERIYGIYFAKNERTPQVKITNIRREYQKLLDRSKEDFFKEMYRTRSTFGISPAVNHGSIANLIQGELPNMEWPLQNNHEALALAVPLYIAGFALFHYAPPQPDRELLHLFFQSIEADLFRELGFTKTFADAEGRLNRSAILDEIKQITGRFKAEYPLLRPNTSTLDFGSPALFAKSYLLMVKDLNLTKAE
jgi:hypothetical protein